MSKPTHGGTRKGAGRPKGPKRVAMTIRPLEATALRFKAYCATFSPPLSYEKGFEAMVQEVEELRDLRLGTILRVGPSAHKH